MLVNSIAGTPATHVRLVVLGYYTTDKAALEFTPITPCAVFDTRQGTSPGLGQQTLTVQITGSVSQSGKACAAAGAVPVDAVAVMVNVIAVSPTAPGNLLISANGATASGGVVNYAPGTNGPGTNANAVPVELANGQVDVFVNTALPTPATNVRLVILGYYS